MNKKKLSNILPLKHIVFVGVVFFKVQVYGQQHISGYVKNNLTQETLPGVTIKNLETQKYTRSNDFGYFVVNTSQKISLRFTMVGYQPVDTTIYALPNKEVVIYLQEDRYLLQEVKVKANYENNFRNDVIKLTANDIDKYPSLFGEKDLIKVVQTLPGVKRAVEGASGFSVRGGAVDQNLILLDNVPIYSYNHLFGLFSMFNTDVVKDVELSKDAISAKYGGRASSVLSVKLKEGGQKEWDGNATIGVISSKASAGGPIIKDKLTGIFSIRRSYIDLITRPFLSKNNFQTYVLADYSGKLSWKINDNTKLIGGLYNSLDKYNEEYKKYLDANNFLSNKESFGYRNRIKYITLLKHKKRSHLNFGLYETQYDFFYDVNQVSSKSGVVNPLFLMYYNAAINEKGIKIDGEKYGNKSIFLYGIGTVLRRINPQTFIQEYAKEGVIEKNYKPKSKTSHENYAYAEIKHNLTPSFEINIGLRAVNWQEKGGLIYFEPRVSAKKYFEKFAIKLSNFSINQFVHQLSSSGGSLPNDVWITANDYAKPVKSNQYSLSAMTNVPVMQSQIYLEAAIYHKTLKNIVEYNNGQNLLTITEELSNNANNLSDVFSVGRGESFGFELFAKYKSAKLDATLSYTLSKTHFQFNGLNFGHKYFPNFDRLHDFSLLGSYRVTKNISVSSSIVFGTASPITMPVGIFYNLNYDLNNAVYSNTDESYFVNYRNNYRLEPYFRNDLALSFLKKKKKFERKWEFSVFNSTARKNPFYYNVDVQYDLTSKTVSTQPLKRTFLNFIPSVNYSIIF